MAGVVVAAVLVVAYLLGTFPSAALVARTAGVDITAAGSGNPGASNVTRVLGWRYGVAAFALDGGKGALAAALGLVADGRPLAYGAAAAAVLGHSYPVTRRFRGGKGVATAGGAVAVLHPLVALALAPLWLVLSRVTRKASVASLVVTAGLPVGIALDGAPAWEVAGIIGLGALVVLRHLPNLRRLARGTEPDVVR
jgi:glycerol-3-phosphate acyltransferase PlsY